MFDHKMGSNPNDPKLDNLIANNQFILKKNYSYPAIVIRSKVIHGGSVR